MAINVSVDFTNVTEGSGFNSKRLAAGDYTARIAAVVAGESKAGNKQLVFSIQPEDHRAAVYPYYCGLDEKSLWKLRNLLMAAGAKVPKGKAKINVEGLVGKVIGIALEDDDYEGKERSTIDSVFSASDVQSDSAPAGKEPEDDADEDEDDDDLDEIDL